MKTKCDVLVVDDDVNISEVVASVLAAEGYRVDVVQSGEEALDLFIKGNYPLVVTDIVMPGLSGIELLKKIKQISADAQVVMMTSQAMLKTSIEALRADAYDYLTKPFADLNLIPLVAQRAVEKAGLLQKNRVLLEDLKLKNEEATRMSEVLRELTMQDGLTGLYNHRHFQELLATEVERSKRYKHMFSLLFMTIDHFMKFNDINGYSAGDRVLRALADLIKKNTRKSNSVARYAFDKFAIILPEKSRDEALIFTERIRTLIADHPFAGRESQPGGIFTVSLGLATFPDNGIDRKALIDHADQTLLMAIGGGGNRAC